MKSFEIPLSNLEKKSAAQKLIRSFMETNKKLEGEQRYGNTSKSETEIYELKQTVAEHLQGMHWLADYILDEDTSTENLDQIKIQRLINRHDLHESLTGDTDNKTDLDYQKETEAESALVGAANKLGVSPDLEEVLDEYKEKETPEALFVKGLDRLEAYLTMLHAGRADAFKANHEVSEPDITDPIKDISPLLYQSTKVCVRLLKYKKEGIKKDQSEFDFNQPKI